MNERIRELIKEADRRCSETRGVYDEILAELVVLECAKLADEPTSRPYESYGIMIKQHFGVKE